MWARTNQRITVNAELTDLKAASNSPDVIKKSEQKMNEPPSVEYIMKTDDNISDDIIKNEHETSQMSKDETGIPNEKDTGESNENVISELNERVNEVDDEEQSVIAAHSGI